MPQPADPAPDELRNAAILAEAFLVLDSARQYGLVTGGPDVDLDRCDEIIARARAAGHTWTQDEIDAAIPELVHELAAADPHRSALTILNEEHDFQLPALPFVSLRSAHDCRG